MKLTSITPRVWSLACVLAHCFWLVASSPAARPQGSLPDGQVYLKEEIKFALKSDFAAELSPADERRRPVEHARLRALHPAIKEVKGGHGSARNWLEGKPLPARAKQEAGKVPKMARHLTAVLEDGSDAVQIVEQLRRNDQVEWACLSFLHPVSDAPNDPEYSSQWALPLIGAEAAWEVGLVTTGIRIAIVDTGVDLLHPDLASRIVYQQGGYGDFANGDAPRDGRARASHGTHVAGIAAAIRNNGINVAGVANARLMAFGCAEWSATANPPEYRISDGASAMLDAIENGADIINCSWGSFASLPDDVRDAVDAAVANDVLVVASAGNNTNNVTGIFWDQHPHVLVVSNTDQNDKRRPSSNYGSAIDLAAPGTDILSTIVGGTDYLSGTSMAAPHVSGAAAMVRSISPALMDRRGIMYFLYRMAKDLAPAGKDSDFGYGRLNLSRPMLQTLREAHAFVGHASFITDGTYAWPHSTIAEGLAAVAPGSTLVLNGGTDWQSPFSYPPTTFTTPITLTALPDKPVTIGQ